MLFLSQPAILTLELTPACGNRCAGCSNSYAAVRGRPPLPAAQWEQWLASFGPEAVRIRLSGGEPTLHPEFERILEAAASYEAWVSIFTNGRWPDPARLLARLRGRANIVGLLVSLHGARASTHEAFTRQCGSFAETLRNVRLALEAGVTVAFCAVLTRQNVGEIEGVVELAQRLGVQHVAFNRYVGPALPDIELSPTQMRDVIGRVERLISAGLPVRYGECVPQCLALNSSRGCLAGLAQVAIDPWGGVKPCHHAPMTVGSLLQQPLRALWHSPAMAHWRAALPAQCSECAALPACHGGCRVAWQMQGGEGDPLAGSMLESYLPETVEHELPAHGRPLLRARLRPEPFGYVVLGRGAVVPVAAEARPLLEACNGYNTCAELAERFGDQGLELLADLAGEGVLDIV
jgi:radical SAM protein with 4Fe4S-binding SPASM domain